VQVYEHELRALGAVVETVAEGVLALADMQLYDEETGLGAAPGLLNERRLVV
jgi:hypothetical protein